MGAIRAMHSTVVQLYIYRERELGYGASRLYLEFESSND
jgi:hypothetical protein